MGFDKRGRSPAGSEREKGWVFLQLAGDAEEVASPVASASSFALPFYPPEEVRIFSCH